MYGAVLPDPIPNSEVKRVCADDTPRFLGGKVGSCPFMETLSTRGVFSFDLLI